MDEMYAAAQQEFRNGDQRPLQVAFGGDASFQGDPVRESWKQHFLDIPLNLIVDVIKHLDVVVDQDFYKDRTFYDVVAVEHLIDFSRWKAEDRLLYYKPADFEDLLGGYKDFEGACLPIAVGEYAMFDMKRPLEICANQYPYGSLFRCILFRRHQVLIFRSAGFL